MENDGSSLSRAFTRIQDGISSFASLPFALQLPLVAIVVLIGGTQAPWTVEHGSFSIHGGWLAGVDFTVGMLTLATGVLAMFLIAPLLRSGRPADSGGVAAIGLLAVVLVGIDGIRIHDASASIGWGLYVSAVAAIALLLGGLLLLGGESKPLPPPD